MSTSNFENYIKSTNGRILKPSFRILNGVLTMGEWIYPKGVADFVRKKYFTPITKSLTNAQEQWISSANLYKIQSRGRQISAWKIGEGPSILFVHGWNGRGVQFQRFFQPALDAGYSVIFFDAPAHGRSEGDMTNYLEITESLQSIFNHDIGKNIKGVIAHSLGASAIINHFSRHHAEIPIVLISPALQLMELLVASFQMHGVPKLTYLKLMREVEEQFQIRLETQNPIDLIHHIDNEIFIIHDKDDKMTPIEPAIQVSDILSNVEILETEGYGHSRILSQKFVVDKAIKYLKKESFQSEIKVEVMEA